MGFARCFSAQTVGVGAHIVSVEVDTLRGLHSFSIVGLPDQAVGESKDRISSAIKNSGFDSPKQKNQKVVVSLAPANLKKEGTVYDLSAALAYLLATEEIEFDANKKLFLGELSLNGDLRPVKGALPIAQKAKEEGFEEIFLPKENAPEAALVAGITTYGCKNLREIIEHLDESLYPTEEGEENFSSSPLPPNSFYEFGRAHAQSRQKNIPLPLKKIHPEKQTKIEIEENAHEYGFEDVRGQETAKRGLEIAAAGGHNALMFGPPGTGKTMLSRCFSQILPALLFDEMLEITGIHSIAGILNSTIVAKPPFRAPHHTASYVSLIGGGTIPKPGEVTLAHRGVLFLDELPEFNRQVLESLREPLEEKQVRISRARGSEVFPANFILIGAMNPCPCGNRGSKGKQCVCKSNDFERYARRISGPILDRIDISLEVAEVEYHKLSHKNANTDTSAKIRERVLNARKIQNARFDNKVFSHKKKIRTNAEMSAKDLEKFAQLGDGEKLILNSAADRLHLSPRAYHRVIKVARTIADLENAPDIQGRHLLEALGYRQKVG